MIETITFSRLLDEIKSGRGIPHDGVLPETDAATWAGYIEDSLKEACETAFWPKLTITEARVPKSGLIAWEQDGESRIGYVEGVYRTDPTIGRAVRIPHVITPDGIKLPASYSSVYLRYMEPAPLISSEEYDNDTPYLVDSVVLFTDGHCYLAQRNTTGEPPDANPDSWKKQPIPRFMKKYLRLAVAHRVLDEDDGKFTVMRAADGELEDMCMVEFEHQGQSQVSEVRC